MDQGTLVAEILDELNKGSGLTAATVKTKIRDALSILETQYSWAYMDRFVEFTIDLGSENPRALPMPNGLKSIEFFRWVKDNGEYVRVLEVQPRQLTSKCSGKYPKFYYKDAMQYIWLSGTPTEALHGEMSYRQFTTYSADDAFEPWPLKYIFPLIKYQTLLLMVPYLREPNLKALVVDAFAQSLKAAVDMNEELENSNSFNQMVYS